MFNILNWIFWSGEIREQKWLIKDCISNHQACRVGNPQSFIPSRLIDVRCYPEVRLVRTQFSPVNSIEDQSYIALSYCWGPSMPEEGKTTSENFEARLKSIDLQQLPKTLRDAINFTHSLGVPFLWVDALCILQGDKIDWEQESSMMSKIYSRALVTVAASTSDHCQGGFLKASYVKKDLPVPRRGVFGLEWDTKTQAEEPNLWMRSFLQNPLLSRGWTLQERELSPRIFHFTTMHVVWECRERVCVYKRALNSWSTPELKLLNLDHWSVSWRLRCFDLPIDGKGRIKSSSQAAKTALVYFTAWQEMVEDYSHRRFTVAADKLPAISVLADAFQEVVKCDYLVGLWRDTLLNDLLWRNISHQKVHPEQDTSEYYAPSWSWGWTNFPISFKIRADTDDAKIIEASVTPESAKGKFQAGYIHLRAKVVVMPGNTVSASFLRILKINSPIRRRGTDLKRT